MIGYIALNDRIINEQPNELEKTIKEAVVALFRITANPEFA
jgi:hypothetical protein